MLKVSNRPVNVPLVTLKAVDSELDVQIGSRHHRHNEIALRLGLASHMLAPVKAPARSNSRSSPRHFADQEAEMRRLPEVFEVVESTGLELQ